MARRNSTTEEPSTTTTTESPEEATVDTTTEDVTAEATVEPTEAPAEVTTTEDPAPASAAEEVDFTEFKAAAEAAVAERDSSTGELPATAVESVVAVYRALPGVKAKNGAKKILEAGVKSGMEALDIALARAWMQLNESMTAAKEKAPKEPKAAKAPADPSLAYVDKLASIRLALDLALANPPEGVESDAVIERVKEAVASSKDNAEAYLAHINSTEEDKGEEPEVSPIAKAAVRISLGKGGGLKAPKASGGTERKVYEGERRSIPKHIIEAFAGVESGTFLKISEIRSFHSEEYGADQPSAGAINNALFPASGEAKIEGVIPGMKDGKRGATKA